MKKYVLFSIIIALSLTACKEKIAMQPVDKPIYGDTGLPKNCRAIVQANIDAYRAGKFSADDAMASLERNCGKNGSSWAAY